MERLERTVSMRKSVHTSKQLKSLENRLNRIEGQVRGLKGLIRQETYCDDVITQISAIQAALNSVAKLLLDGYLRHCVIDRVQEGKIEIVDELLITIKRLMR